MTKRLDDDNNARVTALFRQIAPAIRGKHRDDVVSLASSIILQGILQATSDTAERLNLFADIAASIYAAIERAGLEPAPQAGGRAH
jgi:hypothetical protein